MIERCRHTPSIASGRRGERAELEIRSAAKPEEIRPEIIRRRETPRGPPARGRPRSRSTRTSWRWPGGRRRGDDRRHEGGRALPVARARLRPADLVQRLLQEPLHAAKTPFRVLGRTARLAPGSSGLRRFRSPSRSRRRLRTRRLRGCCRGCQRDSLHLSRMFGHRSLSGGTPRPRRTGILESIGKRLPGSAGLASRSRSTRVGSPDPQYRGSRPRLCTPREREQAQGGDRP